MRYSFLLLLLTTLFTGTLLAQSEPGAGTALATRPDYRPTPEKKFALQHTRLEVSFDYKKRRMPGKVWLTVQPHFYASDVLELDAKGMLIHQVALQKGNQLLPLRYAYEDSLVLRISLDKAYQRHEQLTVYIDYTARPDELKVKGSAAITDAKGLYFINPDGKDSSKPIQIWTQGETEATSVWCPTIDKTNQKTTQQISMTVPEKYVTLSNGILTKQTNNSNGTRTDVWRMDLPHSPYLFFMGVGDYAVIKDKYKQLPVDYYVDKKYASVARQIFGDTPAMIEYFERLLGVSFPWAKYAQIVGEDYVSGAMENTTATLHGSAAYQNARQLKDENRWEIVVAHELFHQWFGDLVTTESWSNLTVNESFADYSETLWLEHKYGKDRALQYHHEAMQGYLSNPANASRHLVRFQYADKEDMFDAVSYQKGGRILHMLRQYLGDSAFFKGMQLYLQQNKFKNAEAHQLRLAMEEVSGRDLNWFFDQWYFGAGHPKVQLRYQYVDSLQQLQIIIQQLQSKHIFYAPVQIAIHETGTVMRMTHWMGSRAADTLKLAMKAAPLWVNIDPERGMLWEKDLRQTPAQWLYQGMAADDVIEKLEVLEWLGKNWQDSSAYQQLLKRYLQDEYAGTRKAAYQLLRKLGLPANHVLIAPIANQLAAEPDALTKAAMIDVLANNSAEEYVGLMAQLATDSSYSVAGAALEALCRYQSEKAVAMAADMAGDARGRLRSSVKIADYLTKDINNAEEHINKYRKLPLFEKLSETNAMLYLAERMPNMELFKKAVAPAIESYKFLRSDFQGWQSAIGATLRWMISKRQRSLMDNPYDGLAQQQLEYLKEKAGL
ncbi:MAG: M1 family metallopeptidase [Chitinophagaceae bacterium]|nr:M1 family metallopeptidase [Chitinophagaceae bacterium]